MSPIVAPPTVFISYTHDSPEHDRRVLELSNRLREHGFDADLDQYHVNESWPLWMEKKVANADFILIVCTTTYLRRWNNDEQPGKGLGAQWESRLTRQMLYESPSLNERFVPVVFDKSDLTSIPLPLRDVSRVVLADGFNGLIGRLLKLPPAEKPSVRTSLAPIALAPGFFTHAPASGGNLHDGTEELISNLFPVGTPDQIQRGELIRKKSAKGFHECVNETWTALGKKGPPRVAYFVEDGVVYSFEPLVGELWEEVVRKKRLKPGTPMATSTWSQSQSQADISRFVKLLNQALRQHCANTESSFTLAWSKSMDCYLFQAKQGVQVGSLAVRAIKSTASRMVFKAIPDKLSQEPGAIQHWQHEAFRFRWMRFGGTWHLVVTPFWAFTGDGMGAESRFQKTSSSNMRKPEKNRAVLGHVLFWRSVLCREADMFRSTPVLRIAPPVQLQVSPSIRDADWFKVAKEDERKALEKDQSEQLTL